MARPLHTSQPRSQSFVLSICFLLFSHPVVHQVFIQTLFLGKTTGSPFFRHVSLVWRKLNGPAGLRSIGVKNGLDHCAMLAVRCGVVHPIIIILTSEKLFGLLVIGCFYSSLKLNMMFVIRFFVEIKNHKKQCLLYVDDFLIDLLPTCLFFRARLL